LDPLSKNSEIFRILLIAISASVRQLPGVCVVRRPKHEACYVTAFKDGRQPDPDPSVDQVIERAKKKRAEFIAALLRRFAVRLKSLFRATAHPTASVPFDA
jgi:hypothetical protein